MCNVNGRAKVGSNGGHLDGGTEFELGDLDVSRGGFDLLRGLKTGLGECRWMRFLLRASAMVSAVVRVLERRVIPELAKERLG